MAKHWKPKSPDVRWESPPKCAPGIACDCCGKQPKRLRCVVTTQVSWMRGDDEVEVFCIPCAITKGHKPDRNCALLLLANASPEELKAMAERAR